DLEAAVHPRDGRVKGRVERTERVRIHLGLELAQHRERTPLEHAPFGLAFARHVANDLLEAWAPDDLITEAVGWLARRTHVGEALSPQTGKGREREAADEPVVAWWGLSVLASAVEEVLQVDGLTGAKRDVAPVHQELRHRPDLAGPLAGAEQRVDDVV